MKILVATQKPFAKAAVDGIRKIAEENGHTLALLEKYPGEAELIAAVADADALIVRSDKVTAAVVEAAFETPLMRAGAMIASTWLIWETSSPVCADRSCVTWD